MAQPRLIKEVLNEVLNELKQKSRASSSKGKTDANQEAKSLLRKG